MLTRSILASLCLRRRRLCRRINCDEELCSVELLSLKKEKSEEPISLLIRLLCKTRHSIILY